MLTKLAITSVVVATLFSAGLKYIGAGIDNLNTKADAKFEQLINIK